MMLLKVNPTKAAEGRAAYVNGATVQSIFEYVMQAYKAADEVPRHHDVTHEGISSFEKAETDTKSYVVGFLDGVLADVRRVAGRPTMGGLKA